MIWVLWSLQQIIGDVSESLQCVAASGVPLCQIVNHAGFGSRILTVNGLKCARLSTSHNYTADMNTALMHVYKQVLITDETAISCT